MADQLWIVFFDGVAQTGVLPYADSEDKALSMWREQAALGPIARARLRAAPNFEVTFALVRGKLVTTKHTD